ncbi:type II secretion system secretin GspD [Brevundimonas sp.]|uniref:type II secretion system secretin GspD n=1 Tax=Brevundimonas sp. TaxID=1871086 RepID=UPI002E142CAB|nr:type II secretion system secretin GspD [Brevundimonas sp.]
MRRFLQACLAVLLIGVACVAPGAAQAQTQPVQGEVVVNMRGVDIRDVAEQVARITGRTIVLDPSVTGVVTVVSAQPLNADGVWDLFQSVLRTNGFGVVRSGRVWRVVPQSTVIQNSAGQSAGSEQQVVTRLIRLRNLPSDQAARALRPLVAQFGSLEAITEPNAIVVTDYADNVARIAQVAQALDGGGGSAFESLSLEHASAEDVAQVLRDLYGQEAGGLRIAADGRSNTVLVTGTAQDVAQARTVAAALDRPGGAAPVTRVVRLRFGDAESVVEVVRGLMGEGGPDATNPVTQSLRADAGVDPASAAAAAGGEASSARPARSPGVGFAFPGLAVQSVSELNAIVLRGTPQSVAVVEDLILQLDVRRPQVVIEAAIVEITGELGEQLGIQLATGGAVPETGVIGGTSFTQAGVPLSTVLQVLGVPGAGALSEGLTLAAGSDGDFGILLQALSRSTYANLLSTPSVTVLDNEDAEIVAGQNVPFRTGSFATDGNSTNPFTTIQREDVGVTLKVTPRILDGDVVRLEVTQEVSSLAPTNIAGAADLITDRRSVTTTVLADNREVITLGGLISDDRRYRESRVPLLADIPGIGGLFRSRSETSTRRTLFVFLRVTILREPEDVRQNSQENYDRLRGEDDVDRDRRLAPGETVQPRLPPQVPHIF